MTVYTLLEDVASFGGFPLEYKKKMIHEIPKVAVINRREFLLEKAKGKTVLDVGATGPMSLLMQKVAYCYHGLDIVDDPGWSGNYHKYDLDSAVHLPPIPNLELVILGEVLEHLSNPGRCLDLVKEYNVPVIITVPNAFSQGVGKQMLSSGFELVNKEHVSWYSYHTLYTLVTRHGYNISDWYWYNGKPIYAEGLVFCVEPINNGAD